MGIKIVMYKAYDKMEWKLILQVLSRLRFNAIFCLLIKRCLVSVSYYILLNGSKFGNIISTKGLRSEDHLSPYLFIIIFEVLFRLLVKDEAVNLIHGIKISRSAPTINHLLYADDFLVQ